MAALIKVSEKLLTSFWRGIKFSLKTNRSLAKDYSYASCSMIIYQNTESPGIFRINPFQKFITFPLD